MKKKDYLRELIVAEELVNYICCTSITQQNRDIVTAYVAGTSQTELARQYGISKNAVHNRLFSTIQTMKKEKTKG